VRVLYCGVEPEKFRPGSKADARAQLGIPDGPPIVLFVGNLVPVKGVDVLLQASATLQRLRIDHRVIVIGEGAMRGSLEKQAARLGLTGVVRFEGVVDHAKLPDWYRAADVFVLPSRSEGVPNVLLEASGCDTPWVASDVGGIPEIADLGRSRLVKAGAVTELTEAIRVMLERPPERPAKGPRSPMEAAAELAEMLGEVVACKRSPIATLVGTK
jgi:glycosyltransferase involved in cell wall biosynthesis